MNVAKTASTGYNIGMAVRLRLIRTPEEFREVEKLQQVVWRFDEREIIPVNELLTAQNNGGLVVGAFDKGKLIGFCFGIVGWRKGKTYHCSRMLAVLPEYRSHGIGYRLKMFQRNFVLKQNLDLMTWTFDPLQSRNAFFNIAKLGGIVREYKVNLYGESSSAFNRGLETDRFVPEWWIRSRRVQRILKERQPPFQLREAFWVNATEIHAHGYRTPQGRWRKRLTAKYLAVEIPDDIDRLKNYALALARQWRQHTREIFLHYFRRGYGVTDFCIVRNTVPREGATARSFYILERNFKLS